MRSMVLLLVLPFVCACSSTMRVVVESNRTTNQGKTFYVMARNVGSETFLTEDYDDVAAKLYPRDMESVLDAKSVFPGKPVELKFEQPTDKDITLYVFFTKHQGDAWRVALTRPLPSDVIVELGTNQIVRVLYRKR
ncbi:MAG: hypothetical protein OXR73_11845 [Myxococcales bacterium]|nr:hypothetical protein [Myxococcales bacterium]